MKQLVQLQENLEAFKAAGISVVAMTYDAPELQQAFVEAEGITYPLLSDIDAASVAALGILNTDYQPGERAYGIPHPGIFVVNSEGMIVGKLFVEAYAERVEALSVLSYALEQLQP
ncbi:redoxin domain-containing protein [Halieaceae bacterium IMCC14734]|uniref:Redoxin domain-containing protein n=1 Tax=Candidatus Litorirhabdus singularis TaxID=2518993 RepID=A0ABT3TLG9_9GAMM|nr:redoxin domain-containing protein [Candidatus Litorirhabdus singularis]MCX2983182.1 redoxin domain-containing protein [Candidatus Litorirhabdus singularis]